MQKWGGYSIGSYGIIGKQAKISGVALPNMPEIPFTYPHYLTCSGALSMPIHKFDAVIFY